MPYARRYELLGYGYARSLGSYGSSNAMINLRYRRVDRARRPSRDLLHLRIPRDEIVRHAHLRGPILAMMITVIIAISGVRYMLGGHSMRACCSHHVERRPKVVIAVQQRKPTVPLRTTSVRGRLLPGGCCLGDFLGGFRAKERADRPPVEGLLEIGDLRVINGPSIVTIQYHHKTGKNTGGHSVIHGKHACDTPRCARDELSWRWTASGAST